MLYRLSLLSLIKKINVDIFNINIMMQIGKVNIGDYMRVREEKSRIRTVRR